MSILAPYIDQLGVTPDIDIAKQAGCSRETVRLYRKRMGISRAPAGIARQRAAGQRMRLTDETVKLILLHAGVITDRALAEKLGCSVASVAKYRRAHGIKRAPMPNKIHLPPHIIAQIGKESDKRLAKQAGCSHMVIYALRKRMMIPMTVDRRRKSL